MRVRSTKSFKLLQRLTRLDQSSFGLAKRLICLTEKLQESHQSLTFLQRCKYNGLTPNCILYSIRLPTSLKPSPSLQLLVENTMKKLLDAMIRNKYSDIYNTKHSLINVSKQLPALTLTQLRPAIFSANMEAKQNAQKRLCSKFDHMREQQRRLTTTTPSMDEKPAERVSIIGDIELSQPAINALAKGPKFVLSPRLSRNDLQHTVLVETAALAYAMRWHHTMNTTTTATNSGHNPTPATTISPSSSSSSTISSSSSSCSTTSSFLTLTTQTPTPTPSLNQTCPFRNRRTEPPQNHRNTEHAIQCLQTDLHRLIKNLKIEKIQPNMTSKERNSIIALRSEADITITKSDKGGEMVVMRTSQLQALCLEHLNDSTTYQRLKTNPTNEIRIKVNKSVNRILTARGFAKSLVFNLQAPSSCRTQRFYALPKTHKQVLKIRPIVSACGGIFDRLGWLLQRILKPLLNSVSAHLNSTSDLLQRFNNTDRQQLQGKIPVSFDVISLYTNIDTNEAIDTALQYAIKYNINLYGLLTYDLFELLHLLLDNNIFAYENTHYYKQTRGLAMGNRLSGTLAIICMDRFERLHIYQQLTPRPTIYVRYVDDVGTVTVNTITAKNTLTYLNKQHPTIKFDMELPDTNGFLPILDIKLKLNDDGTIQYKLYTKPASKGITLHFHSHHPSTVKRATVSNELRRAALCSSPEHRHDAISTTNTKLTRNGYPTDWTKQQTKRHKKRKHEKTNTLFTLNLPFITDKFNNSVKQLLRQHNIPARLVNGRGTTIRDLAKRRNHAPQRCCKSKCCPAPTICQRTSVVYAGTCTICQQTYVGMTTRKLHDRAREHVAAAKQHMSSSAFGEHYKNDHPSDVPAITFKIIEHQTDVLRLHIEEALAINRLKPPLNRRQEHLSTGFLP